MDDKHIGSTLEQFLDDLGIKEEVYSEAQRRVDEWERAGCPGRVDREEEE